MHHMFTHRLQLTGHNLDHLTFVVEEKTSSKVITFELYTMYELPKRPPYCLGSITILLSVESETRSFQIGYMLYIHMRANDHITHYESSCIHFNCLTGHDSISVKTCHGQSIAIATCSMNNLIGNPFIPVLGGFLSSASD